ncbi:MAG: A24 family peptidase [Nitrospira sp.]|nr:A24 family peptidase [Nitrospira sp.]MDH4302827.1 A24 family peptidase [Nitrospira sp.]MDH5192303.1 A24 family peptidase [Nitrospira sp.]
MHDSHGLVPLLFSGLFGAVVGSFLNVCIYRLPRRESVAWPGSHCPSCSHPIAWYDNLPILSYVILAGHCRYCRVRIPLHYPAVEILNGLGYVAVVFFFGLTWSTVVYWGLYSALLVVAGTDLSHKIIPNVITLPGIVLGLISAGTILPLGLVNGMIGALVGGGILWLLAWASPYLFGKEGMGGGDIKLLAMIGAFLGWKPAVMTIMLGSFLGSVVGVALIASRAIRREDYIPFGPFLVCGALVSLFFGQSLLEWYQGLLAG